MSAVADLARTGAWELPGELVALRDTVRRFVAAESRPLEATVAHDTAG